MIKNATEFKLGIKRSQLLSFVFTGKHQYIKNWLIYYNYLREVRLRQVPCPTVVPLQRQYGHLKMRLRKGRIISSVSWGNTFALINNHAISSESWNSLLHTIPYANVSCGSNRKIVQPTKIKCQRYLASGNTITLSLDSTRIQRSRWCQD